MLRGGGSFQTDGTFQRGKGSAPISSYGFSFAGPGKALGFRGFGKGDQVLHSCKGCKQRQGTVACQALTGPERDLV